MWLELMTAAREIPVKLTRNGAGAVRRQGIRALSRTSSAARSFHAVLGGQLERQLVDARRPIDHAREFIAQGKKERRAILGCGTAREKRGSRPQPDQLRERQHD